MDDECLKCTCVGSRSCMCTCHATVEDTDWSQPRRYRSDDRDMHNHDNDLLVQHGENGDWYISVVRHGEKIGPSVRLTTSGTPRGFEEVPAAVAHLYRALLPRRG